MSNIDQAFINAYGDHTAPASPVAAPRRPNIRFVDRIRRRGRHR